MENIIFPKYFYCNHKFAISYPKTKKIKNNKDNFGKREDLSLKSRKSQSLSTNYEDKKENETKTVISIKNDIPTLNNINKVITIGNENKKENDKININCNDKIPFKDIKNIINRNNMNCNYFINNKKLEKVKILKSSPPTLPELFNNMYILSNDSKNYCGNSNYSGFRINKIPNNFYNHLMLKKNCANKFYFSCSITKRIKSKLLTIIFYQPVKNKN